MRFGAAFWINRTSWPDLLRFKDVVFGRHLSDDEVLSPLLPDTLADAYAAGMPVFRFLDTIRA